MHKPNLIKQIISDGDLFKIVSYDVSKKVPVIVFENAVVKDPGRRFINITVLEKMIGKKFQSPPRRKCF